MSPLVDTPAPSTRGNRRGMLLTYALLAVFVGGVALFATFVAPGIGAAGGCGGG
jgi:hypothetical protein